MSIISGDRKQLSLLVNVWEARAHKRELYTAGVKSTVCSYSRRRMTAVHKGAEEEAQGREQGQEEGTER